MGSAQPSAPTLANNWFKLCGAVGFRGRIQVQMNAKLTVSHPLVNSTSHRHKPPVNQLTRARAFHTGRACNLFSIARSSAHGVVGKETTAIGGPCFRGFLHADTKLLVHRLCSRVIPSRFTAMPAYCKSPPPHMASDTQFFLWQMCPT